MHGSDVCECTTGVADGKGGTRIPAEEGQSRVALLRVGLLLGFRIGVDEYAVGVRFQVIADFDGLVRVDVVVPN